MAIESVLQIARDGLSYERLRMDAASRNIAASNAPVAPGQAASQWRVEGQAFERFVGTVEQREAPTREVHEPGHPYADAAGNVRYPDTDLVGEMTTLMTASRGYEANVRSFNLLRSMMLRALDIGAK